MILFKARALHILVALNLVIALLSDVQAQIVDPAPSFESVVTLHELLSQNPQLSTSKDMKFRNPGGGNDVLVSAHKNLIPINGYTPKNGGNFIYFIEGRSFGDQMCNDDFTSLCNSWGDKPSATLTKLGIDAKTWVRGSKPPYCQEPIWSCLVVLPSEDFRDNTFSGLEVNNLDPFLLNLAIRSCQSFQENPKDLSTCTSILRDANLSLGQETTCVAPCYGPNSSLTAKKICEAARPFAIKGDQLKAMTNCALEFKRSFAKNVPYENWKPNPTKTNTSPRTDGKN